MQKFLIKLSVLLIVGMSFLSISDLYGQTTITISEKDVALKDVLKKIEKQTGYSFLYTDDVLDVNKKVSIDKTNVELSLLLDSLFKDLDVAYKIVDKQIVLSKKVAATSVSAQGTQLISGKITEPNGDPIPGAFVYTKDKKHTATTNAEGIYKIEVDNLTTPLIVTFLGMEPAEILPSPGRPNDLSLAMSAKALDEVVITGYQKMKKINTTGAVSTMRSSDISRRSMNSVSGLLEGTIPGLSVYHGDYRIRGGSSINAGSKPLFVVDDFEAEGLPANLDMIENITVLKDAAAAAIWGSRAANGVIVITTKKGNTGDLNVHYNNNFSFSAPQNFAKRYVSSNNDLRDFCDEAYKKEYVVLKRPLSSSGLSSMDQIYEDLYLKRITEAQKVARMDSLMKLDNTEQIRDYFQRVAFSQNHFISLSGSNKKLQYYVSGNFMNSKSNTVGDNTYQFDINSRLAYKVFDKLTLRSDIAARFSKMTMNGPDNITGALKNIPRYQMFKNPDGSLVYDKSMFNSDVAPKLHKLGYYSYNYNLLEELDYTTNKLNLKSYKVRLGLDYNMFKNITLSTDFQYETAGTQSVLTEGERSFSARKFINDYIEQGADSKLIFNIPKGDIRRGGYDNLTTWISKSALSYNGYLDTDGKHYVNAISGFEIRKSVSDNYRYTKYGWNDELLSWSPIDAIALSKRGVKQWNGQVMSYDATGYDIFEYREVPELSYFLSLVYTYDNRYSISGIYKIDNTSLFGAEKKHRRNPLWSLGANWNISNEKFWSSEFFTDLTLRATYGLTGNFDRSGATTPHMVASRFYYSFAGESVMEISTPPNPLLRWEKTRSINFSISGSLLNRIFYGLEVYNNYSYDLLGDTQLDPTVGFSSARINAADMTNKGWEFFVNGDIFRSGDFCWNGSFVLSQNKNKIMNNKIDDSDPAMNRVLGYTKFVEDYPREAIWSYRWGGLDKEGNPMTYDADGKLTDTPVAESVIFSGTTLPKTTGSFGTGITYKSFSFNALFTYYFGHVFRLNYPSVNPYQESGTNQYINKRWKKQGDELITDIPSIYADPETYPMYRDNIAMYSSNSIASAGQITLSEVVLSYSLPESLLRSTFIKSANISMQVSNVCHINFNREGVNPNSMSFPSVPLFSFGMKLDF